MELRPYTAADLGTIVALWRDSWKSTNPTFGQSVTLDELRERLPREISGGWTVHVAEVDGEIAGFIAMSSGTVEQLFVAPTMQGRGIGGHLLDFAKFRAPEGFDLTTAAENVNACRFYRREGLREGATGVHPHFGYAIVPFEWGGRVSP